MLLRVLSCYDSVDDAGISWFSSWGVAKFKKHSVSKFEQPRRQSAAACYSVYYPVTIRSQITGDAYIPHDAADIAQPHRRLMPMTSGMLSIRKARWQQLLCPVLRSDRPQQRLGICHESYGKHGIRRLKAQVKKTQLPVGPTGAIWDRIEYSPYLEVDSVIRRV